MRGAGSALRLERPRDVQAFEDLASAFLRTREAENCLVLGLCAALRSGRSYGPAAPYFAVVRSGDAVEGAAMRTPPFNLILAAGTDPSAVPLILDDLAGEPTDLSGVLGPTDLARQAVDLWSARTGAPARLVRAERIFRLSRVAPPRPARGTVRAAGPEDRELVIAWFQAFAKEALPDGDTSPGAAERSADFWIASRGLHLWIDKRPVSMAGASGPTPSGIRIGAVYTPPEVRRRGYASALVAAVSQFQLDGGRKFCFLFTDLANPTSNHIYQLIGYKPVCDVDEYRFEGPATHAPADT